MNRQKLILAAVAGHLVLTVLHALVHAAIPVVPPGWTAAIATVTLYGLPVAGVGLVMSGRHRIGGAVLLIAGIISVGFEGMFHFLISNPDNVRQVPAHHASFEITAILTTIGNFLLIVAGWVAVRNPSVTVSQRNRFMIWQRQRTVQSRMDQPSRLTRVSTVSKHKPLQTAKFVGILLSVILGFGGFFRIINATALFGKSFLGDGQLLAIILLPLIGLGLACIVFLETLVTGYRSFRSADTFRKQINNRPGYILVRGVEATIAVVGVTVIVTAVPRLVADSTPSPAGVGIMLLLMVIGLGIMGASLVRTTAELVVYANAS